MLSLLYAGYYALTFGHTKGRAADIISAVRPAVEWPYCFLCNTFDNVQIKIHQNARRLSSDGQVAHKLIFNADHLLLFVFISKKVGGKVPPGFYKVSI